MNAVIICSLCLLILGPIVINGLQCYECTLCDNPFNKNNASTITVTGNNQACYKTTAAGSATVRGASGSCLAANAFGYGTWCCTTDLCNAAPSIVPMNVKLLTPAVLFATALIKMIQSK